MDGVERLYRRQYLQPDIQLADQQSDDLASQVHRLALTPLEMGALPLAVKTGPLQFGAQTSDAPGRMSLALVLPYKPVVHADVDDAHAAAFDISVVRILVPLDDPAKVLVAPPGRFRKQLTSDQARVVASNAMVYRASLTIPPGHLYLARLIVRDNLTGDMGTVSFRVDTRARKTMKR